MEKIVAYCGLTCTECPTFLATKNDDDDARKRTAELWSKQFGVEIKPTDINCQGCLSTGEEIFGHCKVCEIRKCGQEKEIENCAHCGEYACEKLDGFFSLAPMAKTALDEIRGNL